MNREAAMSDNDSCTIIPKLVEYCRKNDFTPNHPDLQDKYLICLDGKVIKIEDKEEKAIRERNKIKLPCVVVSPIKCTCFKCPSRKNKVY